MAKAILDKQAAGSRREAPSGNRYYDYRMGWGKRWLERFGVGEKAEDRKKLRNARKQERALAGGRLQGL